MKKAASLAAAIGLLICVAGCDGKDISDRPPTGTDDAGTEPTVLERPPALPQPPRGGLPADLRPPR